MVDSSRGPSVDARQAWGTSRDRLWLAAILLLALAVRLWGIDFGLPNEHARPDERHLIGFTLSMGGNKLNPAFFNYPSLYLYLLLAVYGVYFGISRLAGRFSSVQDLVAEYSLAPEPLYYLNRGLVVLMATATVALVYWIGARLVSRRAGLLSALFLSVAYLHVRDSHFGTVDVPVTFFASLAIALMIRADEKRTLVSYLVAGFVSGLAVSTKYNAIALLAPLTVLHLTRDPSSTKRSAQQVVAGMAITGAGLVLGFLLGTPYALLDWRTFSRDFMIEMVSKNTPPLLELGPGWIYHLRFTLPHGVGIPMLLAAVAGAIVALRARWRTALLLLGFPGAWFAGVGMSHYVYARYMIPLIPMLCLFAAWAVDAAVEFVETRRGRASAPSYFGLAGLVLVLVVPPLWNLAHWNRLMRREDTRVLAGKWLAQRVENGASIGVLGPPYIWPRVWNAPAQLARAKEVGAGRQLRSQIRLDYLRRTGEHAFETFTYSNGAWQDTMNATYAPAVSPQYVVVPEHPAWIPQPGDLPTLGQGYVLVASFEGYGPDANQAEFDRQDAFYAPYAHFDGTTRPGPNLKVFEKVQ